MKSWNLTSDSLPNVDGLYAVIINNVGTNPSCIFATLARYENNKWYSVNADNVVVEITNVLKWKEII